MKRLKLLKTSEKYGFVQQVLERDVMHVDLETALKAKEALELYNEEIMRNVCAA